ncbi:MAG: alanine racemase [Lachnospiraceae bacterium]|nr:alanine racemase [Lachnospiraceae bacterium]
MQLEDIREREFQRVYAQVDLDAITENIVNINGNTNPHTKLLAVIKTDGYGHGSVPIARCLEKFDFMYGYAVATVEEAVILRKAGISLPILILGYTFPYSYEELIREDIRPAVFRNDMLRELSKAAEKAGKTAKVHIKIDTGMSRIGISPDDAGLNFVKEAMETPGIEIEGIFTHFARADETDKSSALKQLEVFQSFIGRIEKELGLIIPVKHCSNSAGIVEMPQANMDLVRPGIILYGLRPSDEVSREIISLRPALSLHSHVVYVKDIFPGQSVSYGGTFTALHKMRIATIPVGYGDGYPRMLSGKGYVLIHGKKAPILGRVCMDQFMVDVTDITGVKEGDSVTLIGTDGEETITAELLGELSGRFNYELVCDLGRRIPRVYIQDGKIVEIRAPYA